MVPEPTLERPTRTLLKELDTLKMVLSIKWCSQKMIPRIICSSKSRPEPSKPLKLEISLRLGMVRKELVEWPIDRRIFLSQRKVLCQIWLLTLTLFHLVWLLGIWLKLSYPRNLALMAHLVMQHLSVVSKFLKFQVNCTTLVTRDTVMR